MDLNDFQARKKDKGGQKSGKKGPKDSITRS
jgi:hypothetical protein